MIVRTLSYEELLSIRDLTLWGEGQFAVSKYQDDPEVIMENLIWRLTQIRAIISKSEVGPI